MPKKTKKSRIHRGLGTRPSAPPPTEIIHGWKVVPYTEAEMWDMQRNGDIMTFNTPLDTVPTSPPDGLSGTRHPKGAVKKEHGQPVVASTNRIVRSPGLFSGSVDDRNPLSSDRQPHSCCMNSVQKEMSE